MSQQVTPPPEPPADPTADGATDPVPEAVGDPVDPAVGEDPEVEDPEVEDPEVEDPEVEDPEVEDPEVEDPEVEDPEVEDPEVEDPEVEDPEVEDPDAEDPDAEEAPGEHTPSRRRVSVASGIMALLLALLGFTFVVQVRSVATDPTLAAARQEDLVRILADLDSHEDRLREDIAELEATRSRLTTAGESQQEALAEAARRADELGILAGTLPATGPGLRVQIRAGTEPITAAILLDAVQEMRGAGAEAIQITGGADSAVRVVGSTYFLDQAQGILIDGQLLTSPYTITVIGEPDTVRPALTIPGGVVEKVHGAGGTVTMQEEPGGVEVTVVREPASLRFARPVS